MRPYGSIWDHIKPYGAIWSHLGPSGTKWGHMGPYRAIWDHLDPSGAIWDHLGPSKAIWDHMEPYGAIWRLLTWSNFDLLGTSWSVWHVQAQSVSVLGDRIYDGRMTPRTARLSLAGSDKPVHWAKLYNEFCNALIATCPRSAMRSSQPQPYSICASIWDHMGSSGAIWGHLGPSRTI